MTNPALIGLPMCVPDPDQGRAEARRFFARLGVAEGPALERLADRVVLARRGLSGVAPASVAAWLLAGWLGRSLGLDLGCGPGAAAAARAAVLLAEAGRRWPGHLLSDGPLPDDLLRALRAALPQPLPRSLPLPMPEQPLVPTAVFGLPRLAGWGLRAEQRS